MAARAHRTLDEAAYKNVTHSIEKEAQLRTQWFKHNEERLNEIANKIPSRKVPLELIEKGERNRIAQYQNVERYPKVKVPDVIGISTGDVCGIMKPVDSLVTKLIYTGTNKDGRINYLKERIKLIPEDRFYFTEVSSFEYGWKFRELLEKVIKEKRFGRSQIIQDTFYRRRGVHRDPEWYREPAIACPTFCSIAKC